MSGGTGRSPCIAGSDERPHGPLPCIARSQRAGPPG